MRIMYWSSDVCSSDLDLRIRKYLRGRLQQAGVSRIVIERPAKKARITIHTARPGVVIGKKGADIEKLRSALQAMTASDVHLNIVERSEEHTSELQSLMRISYAVFCLKKNTLKHKQNQKT